MRIGVVVPVHDEQVLLPECLAALVHAARDLDVTVVVVLDGCTDGSRQICVRAGVEVLEVEVHNAGAARAAGFSHLLASLGDEVWLCSTDGDSRVSPDWFSQQLALAFAGADAVFGVVDVDWGAHPPDLASRFLAEYAGTAREDLAPHPHRHGACFGLRASAYVAVGGMPSLAVGEDHALADRLTADPALTVVSSTAVRVTTSSRLRSRVDGGFATFLADLA